MKTAPWEKEKGKKVETKTVKERILVLRKKSQNQTAYKSLWKDKEKAKTWAEQSDNQNCIKIPGFIQEYKAKFLPIIVE